MKRETTRLRTDRLVGLIAGRRASAQASMDSQEDSGINSTPASRSARMDDQRLLELARREAEALAGTTSFPDLFLPVLLEEKLEEVFAWALQQGRVLHETSEWWDGSDRAQFPPLPIRRSGIGGAEILSAEF